MLLVYAIYDFSAIKNRDHYSFDISGEALEYSSTETNYFDNDCAKPSPQCVKYTNLDNVNNFIRFLKIEIKVNEWPKYDCGSNATVRVLMFGNTVGDLKQYRLKVMATYIQEKNHTRCVYYIDDEIYQKMTSNGYMEDPAFYTDLKA